MDNKCPVCGKEFEALSAAKVYCSRKCKETAYRKRKNETAAFSETRKCTVCGKEFEAHQPQTVCCSPECKYERQKELSRENAAKKRMAKEEAEKKKQGFAIKTAEARRLGISYGMLQAERYLREHGRYKQND